MMLTRMSAAAIACAMTVALSTAAANATQLNQCGQTDNDGRCVSFELSAKKGDPRPARWCGWWLRQYLGVADRKYNRAREWARYGSPASGPAPGVIAVWPSHVGIVTSVPSSKTIVLKSGNDSKAVRERERPRKGVIAWRWPHGGMASR